MCTDDTTVCDECGVLYEPPTYDPIVSDPYAPGPLRRLRRRQLVRGSVGVSTSRQFCQRRSEPKYGSARVVVPSRVHEPVTCVLVFPAVCRPQR
jgi:hypothetical protein